jgi:hypothetical protein
MDKHDKNFLINMSPFIIMALIMFFMMVAFETKADEEIVGHTFDGHAIYKSDGYTRPLFVGDITDTWFKDDNKLVIKTRHDEMYVLLIEACWNLNLAQSYLYGDFGWNNLHVIKPGLKVWPVVDGILYKDQPCYVKKVISMEVFG